MNLGHENVIIDDSFMYKKSIFKQILIQIYNLIKRKNRKSKKAYIKFADKFLRIEKNFKDIEDISSKFDVYICGSDQIWSSHNQFNPYYYLGYTKKKKIAYAPSTGTGKCSDEYKQNTKPFLEEITHISVREESGAQLLSSFINQQITVVLDPTLLLTSDDWDKVENKIEIDTPYILCYFLTPNKWYVDFVKKYAITHNIQIKIFNTNPEYKKLGFDVVEAGPSEFISYIKKAEKIFTDSYHASIFSIIYHKDFVTFKRFEDNGKNDQNSRIADLFNKLGMNHYFIGKEQLDIIETLYIPDYTIIDEKISVLKAKSIEYLKHSIEE